MKKNRFLVLSLFILCSCFVKAGYSDEYPSAYTRAFNNWITTQPTIDKANMNKSITRIELSKMISNYAINVLNKKPDTSKKCEFSDISDSLNTQYDNWVTNACQLWLMWQWITKFRPKDKVTRAEFWTILSRLLYWDKYNWWTPYYGKHLNQLNIRWIMTKINNPQWMELRWNVMVMLKRSETLWNIQIPSFDEIDDVLSIKCEYENDISWEPYFENLTKKDFILPYKDWYFWFSYWGQDWWWFTIEYRKLNNPCSVILFSDEIFIWNVRYKDYGEDEEYGDNYMFYGITEEKAKTLNCKAWDRNNCLKEAKRYFYNLLVWVESNEHFSLWMNALKKSVDNNTHIDKSRLKKYSECVDEYKTKYNVKSSNLVSNPISDTEKQVNEQYFCKSRKIKNYCAYKYVSACPDWNNCESLESEINNCNNIIISTFQTTDEKFPGYNVIYWWEWNHNIIGEKSVYYDDKIWISFKLWKEFDWWVIHDEYRKLDSFEWPRHLIFFYKKCPKCWDEELWREWYDLVFTVQVFDNDNVSGGDFPYDGEMTLMWNNNKYYFMGTEGTKNIDLNIFNVN